MKASHWIQILIGAVMIGLESAASQTSGKVSLGLHIAVLVLTPTLAALGITSPKAGVPVGVPALEEGAK